MTGLPGIITLLFTLMFPFFETFILQSNDVVSGNDKSDRNLIKHLGCYDKIDKEMVKKKNVIYELKSNEPKICLIFLPENVIVDYKMLKFSSEKTFTRVLTGHKRGTVSYTYFPVFSHNVTDDFGPFEVKCPFGVIAFHPHDYPNVEILQFSLTPIKNPVIWSSACPPPPPPS
uniref:Uncharacterized protein n=1 Tax=Panagrolaimus sp. PS1159 TaxID=55785 RepID=A0AC35GME0_9BILA